MHSESAPCKVNETRLRTRAVWTWGYSTPSVSKNVKAASGKSDCLMTKTAKWTNTNRRTGSGRGEQEVEEGGSYLSFGTGFTLHASSRKRTTSPCPGNTRQSYGISGQFKPLSHISHAVLPCQFSGRYPVWGRVWIGSGVDSLGNLHRKLACSRPSNIFADHCLYGCVVKERKEREGNSKGHVVWRKTLSLGASRPVTRLRWGST